MLRVRGEINGFAFRTSLFPTGKGGHTLLVNKQMQAGAKATLGSVAKFRLQPDREVRIAIIPTELERFFREDRSLRRWFDQLSYSMRREIAKWVMDVKGDEARTRRAEQMAERLLATMEAERELPPVLRIAFARNPRAYEGWQGMSVSHRRRHLLKIFYYRNPKARASRIAKTIEEAAALAGKKRKD